MDKICLFDLDGTLADYEGSMRGVLKEINPPDFEVPLDLYNAPEYVQKQMDLIKNKPGFWENLKPLKAGFEILQIAQAIGYTIMVLSKGPGKCAAAWSEKVLWCQRYVSGVGITLTHACNNEKHKGLVYGRVLVDDYPPYIEQWLEFRTRGLVIMPTTPLNQSFNHPNVFHYHTNENQVYEMTQKLLEAFDRS